MARNTDSFSPDMFKLQVDELLTEIQPSLDALSKQVEGPFRRLKNVIARLPSRTALHAREAERQLYEESRIQIPFPEPRPSADTQYTFEFAPPTDIYIPAHAMTQTLLSRGKPPIVDVVLVMPAHLFQDKDYINHRYFHKRAYYMACVAAGVANAFPDTISLSFTRTHDIPLQPAILLTKADATSDGELDLSRTQVRLIAATSESRFPPDKIQIWRNCIRAQSETGKSGALQPTPFYNSILNSEVSSLRYHIFLQESTKKAHGFRGASVLMALWLRQRGFDSSMSQGGFGVLESSILMALLLQKGGQQDRPALSAGYSDYQLFRAFINFIATRDLVKSPLILDAAEGGCVRQIQGEIPVFLDGSQGLNVLFKMPPWSYEKLRHEASLTSACLGQRAVDGFQDCFTLRINEQLLQPDVILRGTLPNHSFAASSLDPKGHAIEASERIWSILKRALDDRVKLVQVNISASETWKLRTSGPKQRSQPFDIYFTVNPGNVDRAIDHGPSAEDREAANAFRRFWGEKAELRRFKDGSITECLVWSGTASECDLLAEITSYVLARHLSRPLGDSIEPVRDGLAQSLPERNPEQPKKFFSNIWKAFESLKRHILELGGLPLQIRQVSPVSSHFRYASLRVNEFESSSNWPTTLVLQFESSGRWPDDLSAIQRTKIALLLKLGELLEHKDSMIRTELGLENQAQPLLNAAFLDITTGAYKFRLRVFHDRELTLLERRLSSPETPPSIKQSLALAVSEYRRNNINLPLHTHAIGSLCARHPFLSQTIRLLKLWCSRHLLLPHLDEELIELLAVDTFTQPFPYDPPGSLRTGFLRTVHRLARWDWRIEPRFVNLVERLSGEDVSTIRTHFAAWRKIDPALNRTVLVVGTPSDRGGIAWTEKRPQKVIAARLTAVAKATIASAMSEEGTLESKPLFVSSLRGYDFAIHMDRKRIPNGFVNGNFASNGSEAARSPSALAKHDPGKAYVEELVRIYGNNIVFMHDGLDKAVVAGIWNPAAGPRAWKVNLSYSTMPYKDAQGGKPPEVTINKAATLHEMARLGGNLVSNIEIFEPLAP